MLFAIISIFVGFAIGIFSGLLGIGGGTLLVPTLRLGFGLSAISSTATSLFAIIPTSIAGAITHIKGGTCIPWLGLTCGIAGALSSPLGVRLASISESWLLMCVAGIIIGYSAITMFYKAVHKHKCDDTAKNTSQIEDVNLLFKTSNVAKAVIIGLFAGLASGYVGVGGGFIMVPMFVSALHVPMTKASGTSLIAVCILAIPGVIEQAILGNVAYVAGLCLAIGCIPGAIFGSKLIKKVPEKTLKLVFALFLFIAAIMLLVNEFAM